MNDDKQVLKYAGLMGHTVAVCCDSAATGRRLYGETCDIHRARMWAAEVANGTIYQKLKGKWVEYKQ